jgi:ATP-binding protein involved in chromosome partitioning
MPPARLPGVRRTVAVASGKGGVGKTTVTVNLALALSAAGKQVGIFDADVFGPNVPLMLGVNREVGSRALLPIARASTEPYIEPLRRFGLTLMSFGLVMGERDAVLSDPSLIGRLVVQTLRDVVWGDLDVLFLDLPPGSGEPQHTLLGGVRLDGAVVVTTPQDLSLLDAGRSVHLFRQAGVPILGVVENMSSLTCPHCGQPIEVFHRTDRPWAVEDETLEVLGRVPLDLAISQGPRGPADAPPGPPAPAFQPAFQEIAARLAARLA